MRSCPTCGGTVEGEASFCPHCGAELGGRTGRAPRHLRMGSGSGAPGEFAQVAGKAGVPELRRPRKWLRIVGSVVAMLAVVLAGFGATMVALRWRSRTAASRGEPASGTATEAAAEVVDPSLSGWVVGDDGTRCYFDPETHRYYGGWLEDEGDLLYIDQESGEPHVGWLSLDGKRYWLDDGSRAHAGALLRSQWLELEDGRYYLDEDGAATVGWAEVDGIRRYFDESGAVQVGWVTDGSDKTYWIKPEDGTLANHEWIEIDGVYQAFDDDGSWVTFGDVVPPNDEANLANLSERQRRVIEACDTTPWPGKGLCAAWVSDVFAHAGEPYVGGDACDMARAWCYSDDLSELKPGMIIAVASHPRTDNGKIWGHVCIYIGNGLIRDSGTYGIRKSSLGSWLAWFGASETPKWGWASGISLEDV